MRVLVATFVKKGKSLGLGAFRTKGQHLSNEWSGCSVRRDGEKVTAQKSKALRKKIQKHARSQAHIAASDILSEQNERKIETASLNSVAHSRKLTERCLRTAYFVGYENRPYIDYPELITLQSTNGLDLGSILHSRYTCTQMIECITETMRRKICNTIKYNDRKIAIITDESTSLSKKACLIVYVRAVISDTPENVFLDIRELEGQDSESVVKCLLTTSTDFGFDEDYLSKNFIAFTSDGASVMLGKRSGVGQRMKEKFPAILLWHCLNHRLELAISDAISSIDPIQTFFDKIYSVYSYSSKLQREFLQFFGLHHHLELSKLCGLTTRPFIRTSRSFQKTSLLNLPTVRLSRGSRRSSQQENLWKMWLLLRIV